MVGTQIVGFSNAQAHTKTSINLPGVAGLGLEAADDVIFWVAVVTPDN